MKDMNLVWILFIVSFGIGFAALEAYGWYRYGTEGTLSAHVRIWSFQHPTIIFVLGCLASWLVFHFWNAKAMAAVAASIR